MDGFLLTLWLLRLAFLAGLFFFLFAVARILLRDLRAAAREPGAELGRLVVVESPGEGAPAAGSVFPLDAVSTMGRGVNNTIVLDDAFASADHAALSYRGREWFLEDLGSTNGTYLNGQRIGGPVRVGFGDEVTVGRVRLRLERARR